MKSPKGGKAHGNDNALGERGHVANGQLRIGPIAEWPAMLDEHGVDSDALLAEVGLSRRVFADPENVIAFATLGRLFTRSAQATRCDHLGVAMGRRATTSSLGAVWFLMQSSQTVREAIEVLARHMQVHDRGGLVTLETRGGFAVLGYRIVVPDVEAIDQMYAFAMSVGDHFMRAMCGKTWRASEVLMPFAPPAWVGELRLAFDAPLRFDADLGALVFPAGDLDRPLATADRFLHAMMLERIEQLERESSVDVEAQTRRMLGQLVLLDDWSASAVAGRMGVSVRTLNRRLARRGTDLRRLREEVRCEAACHLLESTTKQVGEIALILRYSDASAFSRAFRRWRGVGPARWRATHRRETGA